MATSRRTRWGLLAALIVAVSLTLSLLWTALLGQRSRKVILENCSAGHCLRVAEGITSYGLFSTEQLYEIWITRSGSPDYGYVVHHSFAWQDFDINKTIRTSKVEWAPSGVTLIEPTGQRLFVPARMYETGR